MFAIGIFLEEVMFKTQRRSIRGVRDGIHFEVDVKVFDEEYTEFKSTRKSPNKILKGDAPLLSEGWERQVKGYAYTQDQTYFKYATLHLIQAELLAWDIQFTQQELQENWDWLLDRKKVYEEFHARGEPPTAFKYNMDWECKTCPFRILCDIEEARAERNNDDN